MPSLTVTSDPETTQHAESATPVLVAETRDAVRWITALAGAVGAALVAGLQLRDLDRPSTGEALMAAGAVACALLAIGTILLCALRVLAAPRRSLHDLARLEAAGDPLFLTRGPAPGPRQHWLVEELRQRRSSLLGPYRTLDDAYRATIAAYALPDDHTTSAADPPERTGERHRSVAPISATVAAHLESAALSLEVGRRFRHMVRVMIVAGPVFVVAVVAFAFLTRTSPTTPQVTSPVAVTVYVPDIASARSDGLPAPCGGRELTGVAISGTLQLPTVVTRPDGPCPASRLTQPRHVIVVPDVKP